jgi:hypothetical protein
MFPQLGVFVDQSFIHAHLRKEEIDVSIGVLRATYDCDLAGQRMGPAQTIDLARLWRP